MRTGRVIKEYKGGYGRIGQIWITYTKCTICGQENICICSDGSEEEYCGANICYECFKEEFKKENYRED